MSDDLCMLTEVEDITACGQSVQTRGVKENGDWTDETYMDDFEVAFYMCGDCDAQIDNWPDMKRHLEQGIKNLELLK